MYNSSLRIKYSVSVSSPGVDHVCSHVEQSPHVKPSWLISCVHPAKLNLTCIHREQVPFTDSHLLGCGISCHCMSLHFIASYDICDYSIGILTPGQPERDPRTMHTRCVDTYGKFNPFNLEIRPRTVLVWCLLKEEAVEYIARWGVKR